ncbi:glycosyltransferase family 61 protein, partial [Paracoccus rhizosphaerae]
MSAPVIWGGRLIFHFGHLAAEHLNRIPAALYHRPDAHVAVTLPPGRVVADIPPWLWDMLAWYGVAPSRLLAVTNPIEAEQLFVGPQPEHLGAHPPPAWFLDLLDELPRLNDLRPTPTPVVYVTRQGQPALGNGGHAGEGALVRALGRAGAMVIDPARLPLRAQLEAYAGARHLVFAEGSAVHGRQLLGRLDQEILI